ncbi:hypothetical protein [Qipengyuania citrea]|uniref:hypothetical protein n=1 Tax=Qipengyuania citrea TaxID=225971 RepID=UPI0012EE0259|nr:hypothetical protein [Qipengyuania citrea]
MRTSLAGAFQKRSGHGISVLPRMRSSPFVQIAVVVENAPALAVTDQSRVAPRAIRPEIHPVVPDMATVHAMAAHFADH